MSEVETTPLTVFEGAVIEFLLAGDDPVLAELRLQRESALVRARENHSTGLLVDLWIPEKFEPIDQRERFSLDDLIGGLAGVEAAATFYLHLNRGRLATLEVLLESGQWPDNPRLDWTSHVGREHSGERVNIEQRDLSYALRGLDPANHADKGGQPGPVS